jgi:hypothetical protein
VITIPGWVVALTLLALVASPWIAVCLWLDRLIRTAINAWLNHRLTRAIDEMTQRLRAQEDETDQEAADHAD